MKRLALIGLGGMGTGMGLRLLDRGFSLRVYNRTPGRAEPLIAAGAVAASGVADAAAGADVVILSLSDEAAVEEVLFGRRGSALPRGTLLVDTTTVSPHYAREAARRLSAQGVARVEACLVGNPQMARAGRLRVFTAGSRLAAGRAADVLNAIGREVRHIGPAGMASTLKIAFNLLLGAQTAALAEAVAYGSEAGLDPKLLLRTLVGEGSGLRSPLLAFRAEFMGKGCYEPPSFRAALMAKDLHLAVHEGDRIGLALPVAASAAALYEAGVAAGDGDKDAAVVLRTSRRR